MSTSTTTATSTGQFHPNNTGHTATGGSPIQMGNSLYYLTTGSNKYIKMVTANLSSLISEGSLSSLQDSNTWDNFSLESKVSQQNDAHFNSNFAPSSAVNGDKLYCFWVDHHNDGQIYALGMDAYGSWDSQPMKLHWYDGTGTNLEMTVDCDISVHAYEGGIVLYHCYNSSNDNYKVACTRFDFSEMSVSNGRWDGKLMSKLTVSDWGVSVDSNYYHLSSEWFSQGNNGNYMIVSLYSTSNKKVKFIGFPLTDQLVPLVQSNSDRIVPASFSASRGCYLRRDPSGKLVATYCTNDSDHDLRFRYFNTNQAMSGGSTLSWETSSSVNSINKDSEKRPQCAFVSSNPVDSDLPLEDPQGRVQTFPAMLNEVFSIWLYCDGDHNDSGYNLQCQGANYGSSFLVPNYSSMDPTDDKKDRIVISQVFDSFPFPNENIGNLSAGSRPITYTYGTSNSNDLSMDVSWAFQFGIKSEISTSKGVGPAAEVEFSTGPKGALSVSSGSTQDDNFSMDTGLQTSGGQTMVSPKGRADGHTLFSLSQTSSVFYDANNNLVNGVLAPVFNVLTPVPGHGSYATHVDYDVYASTPGNIESYTEGAINDRMSELYNIAVENDHGSYFSPDYNDDYIQKVVEPRAVTFQTGLPYLEFTVTANGGSHPQYRSVDQVVASAGWTVDSSAYIGVGFGEELSLFGFGEELSGSVMGGFSYQLEVNGTASGSSEWGVNAEFDYEDYVPGSKFYTVRMYICQPDNLWAREVQYMAENVTNKSLVEFDSSEPMKIMFVVYGIGDN